MIGWWKGSVDCPVYLVEGQNFGNQTVPIVARLSGHANRLVNKLLVMGRVVFGRQLPWGGSCGYSDPLFAL